MDDPLTAKRHKGERLLEIDNVHVADCGPPPSLDTQDKYVGYFENPYGEQWVFVFDYARAPYDDWNRQAWTGALVLVMMVTGISAVLRLTVRRVAQR